MEALASFQAYPDCRQSSADMDAYDQPDCLSDTGDGAKAAFAALDRLAEGWGRKAGRGPQVMPFLETTTLSTQDFG